MADLAPGGEERPVERRLIVVTELNKPPEVVDFSLVYRVKGVQVMSWNRLV